MRLGKRALKNSSGLSKFLLAIIFLLLVDYCGVLAGFSKMDPQLGLLAIFPHKAELSRERSLKKVNDKWIVDAIVTFEGSADFFTALNIRPYFVYGNIAIASVPISNLEKLASTPEVIYIESSKIFYHKLDKSIPEIGADKVQQQLGYTGKNVLVGIIDSGIDYSHAAFRNTDGSTRIKAILDLSQSGHVYGGRIITEDEINNALSSGERIHRDLSGHGTHIAGIIAAGRQDRYVGVAPDAQIIAVKATRSNTLNEFESKDQIIALAFIDSVATANDMPFVANLSFGGHFGAHDGTSAMERVIDSMVGLGVSGKAVVVAAGNEGEDNIHAQVQLGKTSGKRIITFNIESYSADFGSGNDNLYFDIWYDGDESVSLTVTSPQNTKYGPCQPGNVIDKNSNEGTVYLWNSFYESGENYQQGINPFNGDREIFVEISDENGDAPAAGTWTLEFSGKNATVDAYLIDASMNVSFDQGVANFGKISIPGTASNAITVGSYITKNAWQDIDSNSLSLPNTLVGDLSSFSNPGPTRNGTLRKSRTKPDIMAPGQIVASALSIDAYDNLEQSIFISPDSKYPNAFVLPGAEFALSSGTSFAAPHVSGACALVFEKQPETTAIQLRNMLILSANAEIDNYSENFWGAGKLDAFKLLQTEPGQEPVLKYVLDNPYPNPFTSATTIQFELPVAEAIERTEINVYNAIGQKVKTLLSDFRPAGIYPVLWDSTDDLGYPVASGIYIIEFKSGSFEDFKKVVYLGKRK